MGRRIVRMALMRKRKCARILFALLENSGADQIIFAFPIRRRVMGKTTAQTKVTSSWECVPRKGTIVKKTNSSAKTVTNASTQALCVTHTMIVWTTAMKWIVFLALSVLVPTPA